MHRTRGFTAAAGLLSGGLVAAAVLAAGPAQAAAGDATLRFDPAQHAILYVAADGRKNDPFMTQTLDGNVVVYSLNDTGPIEPGAGCTRPDPADPATAECRITDPDFLNRLDLSLGDQVDRIDRLLAGVRDGGYFPLVVHGGPGNDVLDGGAFIRSVNGDAGNDVVTAGRASGGEGDDVVTGLESATPDYLLGGPGNDTISARSGADRAYGNSGDDLIRGGRGDDVVLSGGPGNDRIYGNSGNDVLMGGPGRDVLSGGPGKDVER